MYIWFGVTHRTRSQAQEGGHTWWPALFCPNRFRDGSSTFSLGSISSVFSRPSDKVAVIPISGVSISHHDWFITPRMCCCPLSQPPFGRSLQPPNLRWSRLMKDRAIERWAKCWLLVRHEHTGSISHSDYRRLPKRNYERTLFKLLLFFQDCDKFRILRTQDSFHECVSRRFILFILWLWV